MDRLAAMEAFVLVVDSGSFSAAARRLNVGQPAISKTVAQLEDRLGVKLLIRSTRGLAPTEAGLNFYERARRSIEEADEAELAARGAGQGLTGKLRICAAVTFARIHLMPRLPEFLARHPDLEMDVVLDDRNIDLVQDGIDVALRMGRLADTALTARRIATTRQAVVGTPAYFACAGEPVLPGELIAHEAVIYSQRSGGPVWTFQRDGAELAVTVRGPAARHRCRGGCAPPCWPMPASPSPRNGCSRPSSLPGRSRRCCRIGTCRRWICGPSTRLGGRRPPRHAPSSILSRR